MSRRSEDQKRTSFSFVPSNYHKWLASHTKQQLSFRRGLDATKWQKELKAKLLALLGYLPLDKRRTTPSCQVIEKKDVFTYTREKLIFESEPRADVLGYLLLPKKGIKPFPIMVCLQGHSPGVHISIGEAHNKEEEESIAGDRDFAIQAVSNGYAALAIEQRCFGERKETKQKQRSEHGCFDATMHSLMLGRTMIGERVGDVMRALDYAESRPEIDPKRIGCMGNSGGGTVTFYSACLEERIKLAVVSCAFCTYKDSLMNIYHCADNFIPGIFKIAEMADLSGLIAPRPFIVVAGKKDTIFPISGVKKAYRKAKQIYDNFQAPSQIHLVIGEEGHRFYAKETWPLIKKIL